MKATLLIKRPYVDLPKIAKRIPASEAQDIEHQLEAIAERAAAMAAYIGEACGTYGCGQKPHKDALRALNRTMKKVRAAMGYNQTIGINF